MGRRILRTVGTWPLTLLLVVPAAFAVDVPLDLTNPGFENWAVPAQTDRLWSLPDKSTPADWMLESYKGVASSLRLVANDPADVPQLGECSLWLNGQILSGKIGKELGGLCNRTVLVSLRARGAGGHLRLALRGYGYPPDERFVYQAEVLKADTSEQWRTYSAVVFVSYGSGMYRAAVELEGHNVQVDDLRMTALDLAPASAPLQVAIPVVPGGQTPRVDGAFSSEEWRRATWLTGFANLSTGALALRQGRVGLLSDGQRLMLCARWPAASGVIARAAARDGAVWQDDALEVYLSGAPGGEATRDLYQFVANSAGTLFDQRLAAGTREGDAKWNSSATVASHVADGWWTLEMSVSLAEVGADPNGVFGLQLARDFLYPAEYTSITGEPFRTLFSCRLSREAPAVSWKLDGDLTTGAPRVSLTVTNPTAQALAGNLRLSVAGADQHQAQQPFRLAAGEAAAAALDLKQLPLSYGRFTLEVIPEQGEPFFRQQFTLNTAEFVSRFVPQVAAHRIECYPVQGKLNVRLTGMTEADWLRYREALIEVRDGAKTVKQARVTPPLWAGSEAHFTLPFVPLDDREYAVRAVLRDAAGTEIETLTGACRKPPLPWLGNKLGRDPVVIPGFAPLKIKSRTLSVWGRDITLSATGFPATLSSAGQPVLAGPMRLVVVDAAGLKHELRGMGRGVSLSGPTVTDVQLSAALGAGPLTASLMGTASYDGFLEYRLQLGPAADAAARQLSLEIPLTTAKFLHCVRDAMRENSEWLRLPEGQGVIWDSSQVKSHAVLGSFVPFVWIGDERRGLAWCADSDRGWRPDPARPCLELVRTGKTVILRVNFLSGTGPRMPGTLRFGLLATPTRPTPVAPQHTFVINYFGFDNPVTNTYSMSLLSRDPFLARQVLASRRGNNQSAQAYLANDVSPVADPATKDLYYEWAHSSFRFYTDCLALLKLRLHGPEPENYVCFQNCCLPSRVDYNLVCLDKLLDLGLSGLYMDNSFPYACRNLQHPACGYVRPDGQVQAGYNLFNTRDLLRRAATRAVQKDGLWPRSSVHMTGAMTIPCFTFSDLCIDGEDFPQLDTTKDFMDLWPLDRVAIFGSVNWGPMRGWLPKLHFADAYTAVRPTRTLLAEVKLFDMWVWPAHLNTTLLMKILDLEKSCGVAEPDTQFLGYWENEAYVKADSPDVRTSFYVRPGKVALIYVSNFSRQDVETSLKLDLSRFGLGDATLTDAETGAAVAREGANVRLTIPWHDFRLLKVSLPAAPAGR